MGLFINNKNGKRILRRTGGKLYIKYTDPLTINPFGSIIKNFTIFPVANYQKLNYSVVASGTSYTLNSSQIDSIIALNPDGFLIENNQNSIDSDTGQSITFSFYYPISGNIRSGGNIVVSILSSLYYSMVKKNWFNGVPMPSIAVRRLNGTVELIRSFEYEDYVSSLS